MTAEPLCPLRFQPLPKTALWGGRRLVDLIGLPLPVDDLIGEAWVLSDEGSQLSRVADGPFQGRTLRELLSGAAERILGPVARRHRRFPLLLKFIDAHDALSVQVHPHDRHTEFVPPGEQGKTEAWVVLHAEPGSRIYAGLKPGTTEDHVRRALDEKCLAECLHWFEPKAGDCVFLPAGTVHALGAGVVIFEVQQSSDITFRLHDWDRVDAKTKKPRDLHIPQSLACIDYDCGPCGPVTPTVESRAPVLREQLVSCEYFTLWRHRGERPFTAGAAGKCRVLVGVDGEAQVELRDRVYPLNRGDVLLVPAELGVVTCRPQGLVTVLECGLSRDSSTASG
jgi:mannose-6-phosphate isomerase